jgi:hypothetical protein
MRRCASRLLPLVQQARARAPLLQEAHDRDVLSLSRRACAAYYAGWAQQHERGSGGGVRGENAFATARSCSVLCGV